MKKLISALVIMFLCSMSYAESMKFVTVLSSPVGTFNKLEAVDSTSSAYGKKVNFCTSIGTQGVVELKGTKPAELTTVALANNTTLGKTDEGKFSLNNITLKQGGNITGGRLFGNTVTVNNAASGKADNLYGNTLTVAGAKTKTLDVKSGASKISGSGDSKGTEEMVWSNEYQEDDACKTGSACAKQYLLKEKGAIPSEPDSYVHQPSIKEVKAAKVCGYRSTLRIDGYGTEREDYRESRAHYYYANDITQTCNIDTIEFQNCGKCGWGMQMKPWQGHVKKCDTVYTHAYNNLAACPAGYSDEQLCQNNCDSSVQSCSFMCLKTAANISGCGEELSRDDCYCPCGTKFGESWCMASTENSSGCGKAESMGVICSAHRDEYEPKLGGTGKILMCLPALKK